VYYVPAENFSVRLPEDVYAWLKSRAETVDRSMAWVVINELRRAMGDEKHVVVTERVSPAVPFAEPERKDAPRETVYAPLEGE
jgi:hypothetical protein